MLRSCDVAGKVRASRGDRPGCVRAVVFRDPGIEGNKIRGNRFIGVAERNRVVQIKSDSEGED